MAMVKFNSHRFENCLRKLKTRYLEFEKLVENI